MIRHYKSEDGISGYCEGDILVNDDTGERSLVVRTGHGLQLEPGKNARPDGADAEPAEAILRNASMGPGERDDDSTHRGKQGDTDD